MTSSKYLLFVHGHVFGTSVNAFLKAYDPDANGGRGAIAFTSSREDAMHFNGFLEAMECWKQQSTVQPIRLDGKPNRPLTAYSVTPIPANDFRPLF